MGIFNFLERFGKEKEVEPNVLEKLTFSEIGSWLEKKKNENELNEKEVLDFVKEKIRDFNADLRKKIILLSEFDVESKKAEERIKGIVTDSRIQYIESVRNLMSNLENIKETKFSGFTKRVDKAFFDFDKASSKNYERATILIGKEMASIKSEIKNLSRNLLEIFNSNKEIPELFQKIELIKSELNSLDSIQKRITGISEITESIDEKINQLKKENRRLLEEIKWIKQSENYKNMLDKKEKIVLLEKELKEEIFVLKQLIDFKVLTNFFHINPEQMKIVKNHKEDFYVYFMKDSGKSIMSLLDEAKLNKDIILEKVNLILDKIRKLTGCEKEIQKDEVQDISFKIKKVSLEIDELKTEKIKEEKRSERLKANKEEVMELLMGEVRELGVKII